MTMEVDVAFALGDTLEYIFQYLNIKDLSRTARVCKSWNLAASREISRRGPNLAVLPDIFSKKDSNFNMDWLKAKPYLSLLFVGPSLRERNAISNLEYQILNKYKKYFPRHLVAVGVDESMFNETVVVSCPGLMGDPNGILGLFFPLYRDLRIRLSSCKNNAHVKCVEIMANKLTPDDEQTKTTIIMFSNRACGFGMVTQVLKLIQKRFKHKFYTLWGGIFDDDLVAIDCEKDENIDDIKTAVFAMSITGPDLESWSTIVSCKINKNDFNKKLLDFRDNLHLKRFTIGLICGPRYVSEVHENMHANSKELMQVVKNIFPKIPILGIFNYGFHSHFGVDSLSNDHKQELAQEMALSLMIITYD